MERFRGEADVRLNGSFKIFLAALVPLAVLGLGGLAVASVPLNGVGEETAGRFMARGLLFLAVAVPVLSALETLVIVVLLRSRPARSAAEGDLPEDGGPESFTRILELYRRAVTDPDTGAVVFRHFRTMLESEVERAKRYKVPLSLVRISLLGKDRSKEALRRVSVNLRSLLRAVDVVAIDPSKDFIVLLPHTRKNNAEMAVWRIWKRVKAVEDQTGVEMPLAAGIASFGEDGEDAASLLETAEEHCRRAAVFGPGKVIF